MAGSGIWTTLPDANGATSPSTGDSCPEGWVDQIHPFLANYMDADCNPVGATGEWHGITGNGGGWRQVDMDLSAYAGQTVELYIAYASDWSVQNLGVFVDDRPENVLAARRCGWRALVFEGVDRLERELAGLGLL